MSDISKIQVGETLYDVKDQTARDNFSNAKITTINNLSDDNHLPTAKAVYDYFNNQITDAISDGGNSKIPTSNAIKNFFDSVTTTVINSSSDHNHFPTAKTVYDYIQNNQGTSSGEIPGEVQNNTITSIIDPNEYYVISSSSVISELLKPENILDDLYKISDYLGNDGVYKITNLEDPLNPTYSFCINNSGMSNIQTAGELETILYTVQTSVGQILLLPEGVLDPSTGEPIALPGVYFALPEKEEFAYSIQYMRKKDNYFIQEIFPFRYNENPFMEFFHKISDNTNHEGLFTTNSIISVNEETEEIFYGSDSGGYFEPIGNNFPDFAGMPCYALKSGALLTATHADAVPSVIIVKQPFMIPAGMIGNESDINVEVGTYAFLYDNGKVKIGPYELMRLQEKEEILDIDNLFGTVSDYGTFTQTLNTQIFTTGVSSLVFSENDFDENTTLNEVILYNMFKAAYEQNGIIKLRLHGEVGGENTDLITPISAIWKSGNNNYSIFGASTQVYLYTNGTWILYKLQIYSGLNYFTVRCEGSAVSN